MGTLQSLRKAYGALKDTTTVSLAKVNSDFKDVDVAIVKATNHVECPPKERHVRKILASTSVVRPRADVAYCLRALARRLAKTHNWTVALKTLIVIHRSLREGDPTFREELLSFSQRGRILQLSNFKDDSSPIAWDCSAWVRTYALFLEERLECFRVLKYDVEAERLTRPADGNEKQGQSRTRELDSSELLEHLPALQQLLYRLIGCLPEGGAVGNYVIQYALALVLKESFKIYCAINDGIINLVDKFFEMPRHEAVKALEIYRRAGQQAGGLSEFYDVCKGLELARNFQFPTLREPPVSFLATMEEYIREAPRMVPAPREQLEFEGRLLLTYKPEEVSPPSEDTKAFAVEPQLAPSNIENIAPPPTLTTTADTGDLLGLNFTNPDASAIEESNALALAIVPSEASTTSYNSAVVQANGLDPSGWELALVTTPSSNSNALPERELAGGFDKLTLDSLYESTPYRPQQPVYGVSTPPNPFEYQDPFALSSGIAPPPAVQMAGMAHQQQQMMPPFNPFIQQNNLMMQQQQMQQQQMQHVAGPLNPFGDTGFGPPFPLNPPHHHQTNPFGNTGNTGLL